MKETLELIDDQSDIVIDEENPIKSVFQILAQMDKKIQKVDDKVENHLKQKPEQSYNQAVRRTLEHRVNETNRIVQNIARQQEPGKSEDERKEKMQEHWL